MLIVELGLSEPELAEFDESIDPEHGERESCIPAAIVNESGRVRHVTDLLEADGIREECWGYPPGFLRAKRERGVTIGQFARETTKGLIP